jgi:hypothetical protein
MVKRAHHLLYSNRLWAHTPSVSLKCWKNKVLDIVKGKIVKPEFEEGEEKEPQNVAAIEILTSMP